MNRVQTKSYVFSLIYFMSSTTPSFFIKDVCLVNMNEDLNANDC